MNVIYSGNFSINWSYFQGLQDWHIYNMYYFQKYAERHGADFKVIDNSNRKMSDLYSYLRKISGQDADGWGIGTLSSIIALYEFVNSKYDNFCWMDLDICIIKPEINVFDYLKNDMVIDYADLKEITYNRKQRFVNHLLGIDLKHYCNSSMVMLTKDAARKVLNNFKKMRCNIEDNIFLLKVVEFFKGQKDFMSDECFFEALLNFDNGMTIDKWPRDLHSEVLSANSHRDFNRDCFSYHFASATKFLIVDFWKNRRGYNAFS